MSDVPNLEPETDEEKAETVTPVIEPPTPQNPELETPEAPVPPVTPDPVDDYQKKFKESSREAQLLLEKNKILEEENKRLKTPHTPTDDELRSSYPGFDAFAETDKVFLRKQLATEKGLLAVNARLAELDAEKQWRDELNRALRSYPQLQGKEADFEKFVFKPNHRGLPIDTLAKSYLFDLQPETVQPTPKAPRVPTVLPGSGGPKTPPAPATGLSGEELKLLREKEPKAWQDYIRTHEITID